MNEFLYFQVGQREVAIPRDRLYSETHMWLEKVQPNIIRVGFSAFAVLLLQRVYLLEWTVSQGEQVAERTEVGEIESSKALSGIYTPVSGRVVRLNEQLEKNPDLLRSDNYGQGWLLELEPVGDVELSELLSAEQYVKLLEQLWPQTQKLLKGRFE